MKKLMSLEDMSIGKDSEIDYQADGEHIDINIVIWRNGDMIVDEMMYTGEDTEENRIKANEIVQELEEELSEYKLDLEQGNI